MHKAHKTACTVAALFDLAAVSIKDAVVEIPALITKSGASAIPTSSLRPDIDSLVRSVKDFELLTRDHTVVQDLLDQGVITEKEIGSHPQRAMLTQALVGDGKITPVLIEHEVKAGDKFLLCSDGLSNFVAKSEIEKTLAGEDSVNKLVELAYQNGAPDNVTVVVAEVGNGDTATEFFGAAK